MSKSGTLFVRSLLPPHPARRRAILVDRQRRRSGQGRALCRSGAALSVARRNASGAGDREIGGTEEEELAEALIRARFSKPVFALLAGTTAPEGVTMGHAGALIHGTRGTATSKVAALGAPASVCMHDARHR